MDGGSYGVIKDAASPRTHADTLQPSKCDKMFIRVKLIIVLVLESKGCCHVRNSFIMLVRI